MQYTTLGNTNIQVSKLTVGGMSFGQPSSDFHMWTIDQEKTTEMIRLAYENGINFIDTANTYAHGTSEEFIGKALKDLGIPRDKVVLASKVYFNDGHLSRSAILREIEGTLTRLKTDYLDLYQIHRFDYDTPIEETMATLNELVQQGKVRALGASAMFAYQFYNMQLVAKEKGYARFETMQNHYNLLYREDERELIPLCKQLNVSLIPYSPLAGGHLSHTGWTSDSLRSKNDKVMQHKYDAYQEEDLKIIDVVHQIASEHNVSMAQIALAWLYHKGVTAPIVGATKPHHFLDAIKAIDITLSQDEIERLESPYTARMITGALRQPK